MSTPRRTGPSSTSNFLATGRPCADLAVLLLEDDSAFRIGLAEHLRDDGHEVHEYPDPSVLPPLVTLDKIAAVVTGYEMHGHDGISFASHFNTVHPTVPIVMVTAYWTEHMEAAAALRDFLSLFRKPFRYEEFHQLLHQLTSGR